MNKNFIEEFKGKLIFGKFLIKEIEYTGINSTVYSGKNINNNQNVALKIQENTGNEGDLEKEAYYLFQLKNIGIPKIISFGHYHKYNVLVEELLGKSLFELFKVNFNKPKIIRLKDMVMAGIQIIERIEYIHSNNIIHLDIKPQNFLVGNPDNSLIYIIDFGLAKKFRSSRTGKHIQFNRNKYFSGNIKYCSARGMKGVEPSRRDDLESLGYLLIDLYTQQLPWSNVVGKNPYEIAKKVYNLKKFVLIDVLCKDLPKEMIEFISYTKSLKFEEDPNYSYLSNILKTILHKIDNINKMNFSWASNTLRKHKSNININMMKKKRISPFKKIIRAFEAKSSHKKRMLDLSNNIKNSKSLINDEVNSKKEINKVIKFPKSKNLLSNQCSVEKTISKFQNIGKFNNLYSFDEKESLYYNRNDLNSLNISRHANSNSNNIIKKYKNLISITKNVHKSNKVIKMPMVNQYITRNKNKIFNITPFNSKRNINIFSDISNININVVNNNNQFIQVNNNITTNFPTRIIQSTCNKMRINNHSIKELTHNNTKNYFHPIKYDELMNRYNKTILIKSYQ